VPSTPHRFSTIEAVPLSALAGRALYRSVGTKNTAIPWPRTQQRFAVGAFVEELAGIDWHLLAFGKAAEGTDQHRFERREIHG
jgi:hypothetical protein